MRSRSQGQSDDKPGMLLPVVAKWENPGHCGLDSYAHFLQPGKALLPGPTTEPPYMGGKACCARHSFLQHLCIQVGLDVPWDVRTSVACQIQHARPVR